LRAFDGAFFHPRHQAAQVFAHFFDAISLKNSGKRFFRLKLAIGRKGAMLQSSVDSSELPRHGESSSELSSVMI
jgi:hypothetical protein